jgi:uncharacterized protein YbjT (DUF2867 family)
MSEAVETTRSERRILLTGATGYVGGRLLTALEAGGYKVRCMARRPSYLEARVGAGTSVVRGDCLAPESLADALEGIHTAFYLVHSMGSPEDFVSRDRIAAANFGQAAAAAGVKRIIYLGGLGSDEEELSAHLRSRHETGEALRCGGVPVIELRASIILGSGSLSFELIRALVQRLPVMICPRWVRTMAQPIAIEDVISYLVASIELPDEGSRVFEIGGTDRVAYEGIMLEYARQRGLRRFFIHVPALTPRLSSLWLGLTTPVYARVGRKLIESIRYPTVVTDNSALEAFAIKPMSVAQAIERAMLNEDRGFAVTRWSSAISSGREPAQWGGETFGTRLVDSRSIDVSVPPEQAFAPIRAIGGDNGWYYADWLWRLRGFIDLLFGGVGMRRGRRHPQQLRVGEELDFWRVEAFEDGRRLRLHAEMKVPGRAWLEFEVQPNGKGGSSIRQTAVFDPWGLLGLGYWYGIYPLHARVFRGMVRAIAANAESGTSTSGPGEEGPESPAIEPRSQAGAGSAERDTRSAPAEPARASAARPSATDNRSLDARSEV